MIWRAVVLVVLLLTACVSSHPVITSSSGQHLCAKHRVPLVTVHGYTAPPGYVHPGPDDYNYRAWFVYPFPNRVPDDESLSRNSVMHIRAPVTFCPKCEQEYKEAMRII